MSDILKRLRRMEYPRCAQSALDRIESSLQAPNTEGSIPGLEEASEEMGEQLAQEFIFCEVNSKGHHRPWLSAIQELQLMDLFVQRFSKAGYDRTAIFKVLFKDNSNPKKKELMFKTVSMSIGVQCSPFLDATASWMQSVGCSSDDALGLAHWLIQDYCVLVPGVMSVLQTLPSLSPHFTCNLITTLTMLYKPKGSKGKHKEVWLELLDLMMDWMQSDSQLCLISLSQAHMSHLQSQRSSLWTSPTKPNTQTPIPGLVRWVTQAPLLSRRTASAAENSSSGSKESAEETDSHQQSWSRLHLAVLHTIQSFPHLPGANQLELITLADMNRIIREVVVLMKEITGEKDLDGLSRYMSVNEDTALQCSTHRLVQILQVALATGAFRCSLGDLQNIINSIPRNKLLDILQIQHLARTPPPMHFELR